MKSKSFGATVKQTLASLRGKVIAGGGDQLPEIKKAEALTRIFVSVFVLIFGAFLMAQKDPLPAQAGGGLVGLVVGYWLR